MEKIFKRYIDTIIKDKLNGIGALVVNGPKFCGKTTSCMNIQKSYFKLDTKTIIASVQNNPNIALEGEKPHLIDEWQMVPDIWNHIKSNLDRKYEFGKYLLTGNSTPADMDDIYHSGAGRITTINMRTLSLTESEESNCCVSLKKLFNKQQTLDEAINVKDYKDVLFYMCRGGWPLSCKAETKKQALDITKNYFNNIFHFENSKNAKFRNKNPGLLNIILKNCARRVSSPLNVSKIMNDLIKNGQREKINRKTFDDYFQALEDLFLIKNIESWNPNLRSKTIITSSPIIHFVDTSLACAALNATPENLEYDINTAGLLFEDFAVRDLSIYSSLLNGTIKHYRDANGLECDTIITLEDGRWAPIEIKIGGAEAEEEACDSLSRFMNKVATSNNYSRPTFAMVVTAWGQPRISKEGIFIVPITCLTD